MFDLLGEILGNLFGQIGTIVSSILVIWAIIDCLTNKRLGNKGLWFFLIIFTQFIGALIYFLTGQAHTLIRVYQFLKKWLWQTNVNTTYYQVQVTIPNQPPRQPVQEQPPAYQSYEQGYQSPVYQPPAYTPPAPQYGEQAAEQSSLYTDYEQPQAMYPEMPQ